MQTCCHGFRVTIQRFQTNILKEAFMTDIDGEDGLFSYLFEIKAKKQKAKQNPQNKQTK